MSDLYWLCGTQNAKLDPFFSKAPRQASCDRRGWPSAVLTAGQRSDYIGARALLNGLPPAEHMPADRGYDADWYREASEDKGITPSIPSRKNRKVPIPHDESRYRKRHKIENSLARPKDWHLS